MTTPRFDTVTALAERHGLGHTQARERLAAAGVPQDAKGRYEAGAADEALELSKNEGQSISRALAGQANTIAARRGEALAELADARRLSAMEDLRIKRMKADRLQGALVSRASVEETGKALVANLRKALGSLPVTLAPRLTGETDTLAIATILREEIDRALGALADEANALAVIFGERMS